MWTVFINSTQNPIVLVKTKARRIWLRNPNKTNAYQSHVIYTVKFYNPTSMERSSMDGSESVPYAKSQAKRGMHCSKLTIGSETSGYLLRNVKQNAESDFEHAFQT